MNRRHFLKTLSLFPLAAIAMKLNVFDDSGITNGPETNMPALFLGHGSPMNAIEENEFTSGFKKIAAEIPKPRAILCISAHWETKGTFVSAMEKPPTIHDFGGFPQALYQIEYPAPGSPTLANEVKESCKTTPVNSDLARGLDHGAWTVIRNMYPHADIPVVQLSLNYSQSPQFHYNLGKELAFLRKQGVLVMGSGNLVHNLGRIDWNHLNEVDYAFDWAREAQEKMNALILNADASQLINYNQLGTSVRLAVPTPEHFLPLLYVLALKNEADTVSLFNDKAVAGSLTMTSVKLA